MAAAIPDGLVVLTFDDSVSNHATVVAPLLKKHGFGGTFYITEFVGDGEDRFDLDKRQYMTWEQIVEIDRLGFEIGNHTLTHRTLRDVSRETIVEEIDLLERRCAEYGIERPVTFCYPGGTEDPSVPPVLRERGYRIARGCGNRAYVPGADDPLSIPSYVVTGKEEALFQEGVAQAKAGRIAVFTFHGVPEYNHPWVDTSPEIFERMIEHLRETGCKVIAMRDLAGYLE